MNKEEFDKLTEDITEMSYAAYANEPAPSFFLRNPLQPYNDKMHGYIIEYLRYGDPAEDCDDADWVYTISTYLLKWTRDKRSYNFESAFEHVWDYMFNTKKEGLLNETKSKRYKCVVKEFYFNIVYQYLRMFKENNRHGFKKLIKIYGDEMIPIAGIIGRKKCLNLFGASDGDRFMKCFGKGFTKVSDYNSLFDIDEAIDDLLI